ncbi:hypothetical protein [Niabella ginsengisoli]|uniref:Uncharacterized protein n=1 Tax=Niabella ginsengisoli TaxID=522298 RepID=A0ABS9SHU7_9BACT|nr:hypothetical protein [Niabella ginsengisoli]MCH5597944.1 hypothetical protein [Niabella ginsengisoli]
MNRLYKSFRQLCKKKTVRYNESLENISSIINRWFKAELQHLAVLSTAPTSKITKDPVKPTQKILCNLSIDQMALILRAADDERIISARSLNDVFKDISPHLSTARKETISADSMRSKSYNSEPRDKKIAMEILEKIRLKIKEY